MAIVRIASVPLWTRSRPRPRCFYLYILSVMLLWVVIINWLVLNNGVRCWFKNYFASTIITLFWTWVVITIIVLWCMAMYLWTLCNIWHGCWIMYDLGSMLAMNRDPSWYSMDYRVYMGSSMIVGPLKALAWFWWIDETLCANLIY